MSCRDLIRGVPWDASLLFRCKFIFAAESAGAGNAADHSTQHTLTTTTLGIFGEFSGSFLGVFLGIFLGIFLEIFLGFFPRPGCDPAENGGVRTLTYRSHQSLVEE